MKALVTETKTLPEGVSATFQDNVLTLTGKNTVTREFKHPSIAITLDGNTINLKAEKATQREKRQLFTFAAHIRNMMKGAQEDHVYKLKVCSGHFPMNVSISNNKLTIKNFLGEAVPRVLALNPDVNVKLDGDIITVSGPYIEKTGQQAAAIEQLTRITNRDRRIFQDGVYIIEKDGAPIL